MAGGGERCGAGKAEAGSMVCGIGFHGAFLDWWRDAWDVGFHDWTHGLDYCLVILSISQPRERPFFKRKLKHTQTVAPVDDRSWP
jgi:hypothetical protein